MASTENLTEQHNLYDRLMNLADPRVGDFFLMQSPAPITVICAVYIYYVTKAGPKWMKDKEPYKLRKTLIVYNALQTAFSAWLFYEALIFWVEHYGWSCVRMDHNDLSPHSMWAIKLCHYYFLSKISELADTVFFVLKKKQRHISVLHVFHHAVMPFSVWFGVKFFPGGNLAFFGLINLFVHIWMYLYYMLAAMGPEYQKYVWWKRHITEMQLTQFVIIMAYMAYTSYKCSLSRVFIAWIIVVDIVLIYLFTDFYMKAYRRKEAANKAAAEARVLAARQQHEKVQ